MDIEMFDYTPTMYDGSFEECLSRVLVGKRMSHEYRLGMGCYVDDFCKEFEAYLQSSVKQRGHRVYLRSAYHKSGKSCFKRFYREL